MCRLIALFLCLLPPLLALAQVEPDCTKMLHEGDVLMARKDPPLEEALRCYLNALNCNSQLAGEVGPKLKGVFDAIKKQKESEQTEKTRAQKALENSRQDQIKKLLADADAFRNKGNRFPDALRAYENALNLAKPVEKAAIEQERSATLTAQTQFDFERNRDIGLALISVEDGRAALPYLLKAQQAKPADSIVQKAIARCDTTTHRYVAHCGTSETCLCDSFYAAGQTLRGEEHFDDAVKRFEVVAQLCPERNARAVIDSIYREHRIWIYQDGKFAIATPLGEPITPFQFSNPEPFHKGVAIYSENDKYFFVDKEGKVLTPGSGYDGIMKAEGKLYYLIRKYYNNDMKKTYVYHGYTDETGQHPVYWKVFRSRPLFVTEIGPWFTVDSLQIFFKQTNQYDDVTVFPNGIIGINKGGMWGLIDKRYKEITAQKYYDVWNIWDGTIRVRNGFGHYLIDQNGCEFQLPGDVIYSFQEGVAWVEKGDMWGLFDINGKAIIEPLLKYNEIRNFHDNVAWFKTDGKWGLMDKTGKEMIAPHLQYEEIHDFYDGVAWVKSEGKWGVVDKNGKEVIVPDLMYEKFEDFKDGVAWIKSDGKWGLIDKVGRELIVPHLGYEQFRNFNNDVAWVKNYGKWGLVNKTGSVIIVPMYESVLDFQDGFAGVKKDGIWRLIDTNGNEKITIQLHFDESWGLQEGVAKVKIQGKWGFINENGQVIITPQYENAQSFQNGVAGVQKEGKWGYINKSGLEIIKPQYEDAANFQHGIAWIKKEGKWGVIDSNGREVINPQYESYRDFQNDVAWIKKEGRWGFISKIGLEIFNRQYDDFTDFNNGVAWVYKEDKWGLINKNGLEIINPQYDDFTGFNNGVAWVYKEEKWGVVDSFGREIIAPQYDYQNNYKLVHNHGKWELIEESDQKKPFDKLQYTNIGGFYHGVAWAQERGGNKWGLIDTTGSIISAMQYDLVSGFTNDVAWVKKDGKLGFVAISGREIVPCILDSSQLAAQRKFSLYVGNKKGLLFADEKTYIPPEYDEIAQPRDPWVMVMKNNKWGWVDHRGNVMIPCRYDAATPFNEEGWATVLQFGMQFRINKKGEMIWRKE